MAWGGEPEQTRPRPSARHPLLNLFGAVAMAALLVWFYEAISTRVAPPTADGATALLEGHSIATGNVLLHGWSLSLDSFWALEALWYAICGAICGVHLYLVHLVPALIGAAVVAIGLRIATAGLRSVPGRVGAIALILVVFVLGSPTFSYFFLQGPWHIATCAYCLAAFWLVAAPDAARTPWRAVLAAVVLTLGALSDLLTVAFGVAPLVVYGLARSIRQRSWRSGAPLSGTGLGALGAFVLVRALSGAIGFFALANRNLVISPRQLTHNLQLLPTRLSSLFGLRTLPLAFVPSPSPIALAFRAGALAFVVVGVVAVLARALRRPRSDATGTRCELDGLLGLGALFDAAFFVVGSANGHVEFTKYLTAGVVFTVLIAARSLGALVESLGRHPKRTMIAGGLLLAGLAVTGGCAVEVGSLVGRPAASTPTASLTALLVQRRLGAGVGSYPIAPLVTVGSSMRVLVYPVAQGPQGVLGSFDRQRDAAWYERHDVHFVVFDRTRPWHGVDAQTAIRTFGPYQQVWNVGPYEVLYWKRPLRVEVFVPVTQSPVHILWR